MADSISPCWRIRWRKVRAAAAPAANGLAGEICRPDDEIADGRAAGFGAAGPADRRGLAAARQPIGQAVWFCGALARARPEQARRLDLIPAKGPERDPDGPGGVFEQAHCCAPVVWLDARAARRLQRDALAKQLSPLTGPLTSALRLAVAGHRSALQQRLASGRPSAAAGRPRGSAGLLRLGASLQSPGTGGADVSSGPPIVASKGWRPHETASTFGSIRRRAVRANGRPAAGDSLTRVPQEGSDRRVRPPFARPRGWPAASAGVDLMSGARVGPPTHWPLPLD